MKTTKFMPLANLALNLASTNVYIPRKWNKMGPHETNNICSGNTLLCTCIVATLSTVSCVVVILSYVHVHVTLGVTPVTQG